MADVMSQCGFNTLRNFNRVFKEITGMAPSQMPDGFVLDVRSLATEETSFDP
ncbi:MAG: AraC family transcriptional regulator, partial [Clostridia bacterium]|nr:AraC family transcriptional regulator [Clostridia bacterium]